MTRPIALARSRIGNGPPIVLVHGSGTDRGRWAPVLRPLADRFAVHAVDRRGHGESADRADYRIEDEFGDLAALLDGIGDDRTTVVAHSYGALCALGAASRNAPVGRLVLYEPPLAASPEAYCPPGLIAAMRAAIDRGDPEAAAAAFASGVLGMGRPEIERRRRLGLWDPMVAGIRIVLRELESVARYAMQAPRFAACAQPTLLLVGGNSAAEYHATAAALVAVLPNSRVQLLQGQGHRAIDTAPELFVTAVLEFIDATRQAK
ncbi:MAG: alpha/beta hydrolase [Alphaproteobacteria bacterium]|nr:alpha/beta hydrolase [Alphaproteobacteria bacterium]MBV9858778.1 alpha/beta hydrolase [Alphaproteobacteria bacterium]